jgi:hypothetical protein
MAGEAAKSETLRPKHQLALPGGIALILFSNHCKQGALKMIRCKPYIVALALLAAGALVAYPVYAHCGKCAADGKKIATMMDQNKVNLVKSIEAAEKHSKGRAIAVISELHDGKLQQEVYCMVGDKIMKCNVDGQATTVADMKEAKEFPITEDDDDHAHASAAKMITNQVVEVGCGSCVYKMQGVKGCDIAVKIDGKQYLVSGANVDAHQFCAPGKKALVSGRIEGDRFLATKFEVQT